MTNQFVKPSVDGHVADEMKHVVVFAGHLWFELEDRLTGEGVVNRSVIQIITIDI